MHRSTSPRAAAAVLLSVGLALALGAFTGPSPLAAQDFPVFAGGEVRGGLAFPAEADRGWSLGADVDLGPIFPGFRIFTGLHGFGSSVAEVGDDAVGGDLRGTGLRVGSRFTIAQDVRFIPYVSAAVAAYRGSADAPDPGQEVLLEDRFGGTKFGWSLSAGLTYPLEPTGQVLGLAELRRKFGGSLRHWAFDVGLRLQLR